MNDLTGKVYFITGIASHRSIAYGIAESLSAKGAQLILTYQNSRFLERIREYQSTWNVLATLECDVSQEDSLLSCVRQVSEMGVRLHGIVHSIAFADAEQLDGRMVDVISRDGFLKAHEISSFSFCDLVQKFQHLLVPQEASIITLTYLGSQRYFPNYNVMGLAKASLEASVRYLAANLGAEGIRVNAISPGPIKTLAASGIKGLKDMIQHAEEVSLLKRSVTTKEIGDVAAFLLSPQSSAITGQILYADGGYSVTG